jgi:RHS repeat-associated protein
MPGRKYATATYRFGFNGKENDNELKGVGNSVVFEARMCDPRLGRWLSIDALASKYSDVSPFVFVLNSPIQAKDPDGNVVIFINGQHPGTGGTSSYWHGYDLKVMDQIGDHSARYVDGALGGWQNTGSNALRGSIPGTDIVRNGSVGGFFGALVRVFKSSNVNMKVRIAAGTAQGMKDAADIYANLKEGESVKIVTHSMGTAFARGYVKGLNKWAEANGKSFKFEYELDVNAFQGANLPASSAVKETQNKTGGLDGGNSIVEAAKGNSVPGVGKVPGAKDTTDPSDATKGHAVSEMSTTNIPELGNGGNKRSGEQGINNENKPK